MSEKKGEGLFRADGQVIPKMQSSETQRAERRKKIQEMDEKVKKEGLSNLLKWLRGAAGSQKKL